MNGSTATLRSSIGDAVWLAKERVADGVARVLRALGEILRWPFERLAWALERWLVWPLQERTGYWSAMTRGAVLALVLLLAAGGVAGGVLVGQGAGTNSAEPLATQPAGLAAAPTASEKTTPALPFEKSSRPKPLLKGAAPQFTPEADHGAKKPAGAVSASVPAGAAAKAADASSASPQKPATASAISARRAGPAAIEVARRFAGAFVLYETGRGKKPKIRAVFGATATPQLTRSLMKRPPRLPADVQVPTAKVLNIVPGPHSGVTYTFSVSLLRVGVTSELRIDMQRGKKNGKWQVTDVLG